MTVNQEARRVADEQLIAYNAKDMVAFLDLFHQEAVLVNLPGQTVIAEGIQAIREMYEVRFKTPGLRCEVHHRSEIGNIAIDRETVHSNDNHPLIFWRCTKSPTHRSCVFYSRW